MIIIIDYGMGNIRSIKYKLEKEGYVVDLSSNSEEILSAEKLILPGVGHFQKAMENLNDLGLIPVLNSAVMENRTPILGICLGMQLFGKFSEEGACQGLSWIDGEVVKFDTKRKFNLSVPHVGWNYVEQKRKSNFGISIKSIKKFYFTHSYFFKAQDSSVILGETSYGHKFVSAIEQDNILGVQFHPEKSHKTGFSLILDFIRS